MPDDPRIQELLDRLSDSDATPEEVCGSCVELLPAVRDRWRQMCRVREELDALFPPEDGAGSVQPGAGSLPAVPGYEVEAELGHGGMGVVYRARHVRLNRVIALKMILAGGPQERERFRREAEAAAALRHPNVVQVHDVGDAAGRPYLTMEYLDGGSLAQKLEGKPLPIREAAGLLLALTGAVEAAHRAGIVHRDLKPANVMLSADGTPKVADFGLARRLDGEAGLTRTGTAVGTPSYMAPEQAGESKSVPGPAADIYSLGVILYELLTGRPPFQAGNAAVTIYRAVTQDPVPPSRLNAKVPRDLETVCLKCLGKEPRLRYPSAAALGDDLRRFLDGEAVAARPEGPLARLVRRARRRPVLAAAVAVAVSASAALLGGGAWTISDRAAARRAAAADRAATERAADEDLTEMEGALRASAWPAARAAWERARGRLGERGAERLHARLDQGERDLRVAERLRGIRLGRAGHIRASLFREYRTAFQDAGLFTPSDRPAAVAERVRASNIRQSLVDAIDNWSLCATGPGDLDRRIAAWLYDTLRAADPDSSGWRDRVRDPQVRKDEAALAALADAADVDRTPVTLLVVLGELLHEAGGDAAPFLKKVHRRHPDDLWTNFALGHYSTDPADEARYYQAALAIWPESPVLYYNLGHSRLLGRRPEEAVEYYAEAVRRDPGVAVYRAGLGRCLLEAGRNREAQDEIRQGLALEPDPPTRGVLQDGLRRIAVWERRWDDARVAWGKALDADPPGHPSWYGYAELCAFLDRKDEYGAARTDLLHKFGAATGPSIAERTSRACLLLPLSGDELRRAVALAGRAAAADRSKDGATYPYYQFAKGLAEFRQGHFDRTIAIMHEVMPGVAAPSPRLVLAMALQKDGKVAEARKTLAEAILSHDWRADQVKDQDGWIYHSLRREAEGLLLPNRSAFLEGKYRPRDNDECITLLGVCQFTNRTLALTRLYAGTFADAPSLAEDFRGGYRSSAARSAALAGRGRGTDAAAIGETERANCRSQARKWLRADLANLEKLIERDPEAARAVGLQRLTQWREDPDLAGVRDPAELNKMAQDERKDCLALWDEVGAVLLRCKR